MIGIILLLTAALAAAQTPDPAYAPLEKAYTALRAKDYDRAIAAFQEAVKIAPDRPAMRKDLAYTLLKIGENEAARDQFRRGYAPRSSRRPRRARIRVPLL